MIKDKTHKVVYIHGRPNGHPLHDAYARALDADFVPVDFILPWHENPNPSKIRKYFSWILCAFFFPKKRAYSIFFTESIREPILIMKLLGLMNSNQKLIPLMANETLFFYLNSKYSKIAMWMIKKYLEKADAIICVGDFQTQLAKQIISIEQSTKIKTITNWVFSEKSNLLSKICPDLNSNKILFVGDISTDFRAWYKGVDLMISAFTIAASSNKEIVLEMIGINDESLLSNYFVNVPEEVRKRIIIGIRQPIFSFLGNSSLYLHCARGEAWGITIMEALIAGVPVICSDLTGAKEVVTKVLPELVVSTNESLIADKILWYFNLPLAERLNLSKKGREVMFDYTEEKSLKQFNSVYNSLLKELYV